jgi:predicted phage terminase large subunit-like protein
MEGFVETYLLDSYEHPQPTPQLHREIWKLFTSRHDHVAIAAPRGHAKTTAGTHAYGLASLLFGEQDFALLVGSTERMAVQLLSNMRLALTENEGIIQDFGVTVIRDNETELVARVGGRECCIIAKGSGQKVRGTLWRQKRPGLVLMDDMEDDEQVMNSDRREKMRDWIMEALMACGNDWCLYRMLGTILHSDSALERFLNDDAWYTRRFRAHESFDDFSNILWPEKFPSTRLRDIRQRYINQGNPSGYSQEYLSQPIADTDAYFRRADFIPMVERDFRQPKKYYGGVDFAISQSEHADQTAFTIGGVCPENFLHIVDCRAGRWDPLVQIETWFSLQERYKPEFWVVEAGQIEKALGPFLRQEMIKRGVYMDIIALVPTKDKPSRAKSIQLRMRAGGCRFDAEAEWFEGLRMQMLEFPRGGHDDMVDSMAYLGLALDKTQVAATVAEEEEEDLIYQERHQVGNGGRSVCTGY